MRPPRKPRSLRSCFHTPSESEAVVTLAEIPATRDSGRENNVVVGAGGRDADDAAFALRGRRGISITWPDRDGRRVIEVIGRAGGDGEGGACFGGKGKRAIGDEEDAKGEATAGDSRR